MTTERCERTFRCYALGKAALIWLAWILPWVLLIVHLRTFWTLGPDYQYGWAVLPLGIYLLFRRWTSLDATSIGNRGSSGLAVLFAFLILPIWWIRAATPDWSVISYALAFTVIAYTLALLANRTSWATAWRVAFPVCFILCAVPWPQRAENAIIQTLTKLIAAGAVEALQWMGIGAVRQGNLVSLGNGTVGISDACSGIRSVQSMLVASLSLGELYALRIPRRLALVAASLVIALAFNFVRNIILALIAYSSGMEALEHWHDRTGWAILLLSLPLLFLTARRWQGVRDAVPTVRIPLRPLPMWSALTLTMWFCAVAGGVELWYRSHEWHATAARRLEIHWPGDKAKFETVPIDDRTRDVLLCSEAQGASWTEEDGTRWNLTSITWAPRQTSAQLARAHRPEVCFQATGLQFLGKLQPLPMTIPGGALLFEPLEFEAGHEHVYVFFCLYEEANRDERNEFIQTRWTRIDRAFLGQRNLGQQSVELSVRGFPDYTSALQAVSKKLPALLSLDAERQTINHASLPPWISVASSAYLSRRICALFFCR